MINENALNDKAWWRFLKVVYIFIWSISLLFIIVFLWSASYLRPHLDKDIPNSSIICDSGNKYVNHYEDKTTGETITYVENLESINFSWNKEDKDKITTLCQSGFKVEYAYKKAGSWWEFFKTAFLVCLFFFAVIEIIKSALLYILGINVYRGVLKYVLLSLAACFHNENK